MESNIIDNTRLISVIVPVYRVEKELDKCIGSIVHQTYKNIELILVDDGSPDACPRICDSWANKDSRIKVLHTRNQGLSAARNTGVAAANGELIVFVDSDDYVDLCFLERLIDTMLKTDADIVCCGISEEDELLGKSRDVTPFKLNECLSAQKILHDASFYEWQYVVAWNKLYKKELLDGTPYPVGRYHEDEFIYHHLLLAANKIAFVCDPLYHYVRRSGSIMMTPSFNRTSDIIHAMNERMNALADDKGCEEVLRFSCKRMMEEYSMYLDNNKVKYTSIKDLSSLCKSAAYRVSMHAASFKEKVNIIGFRLSPYLYAKLKGSLKSILNSK